MNPFFSFKFVFHIQYPWFFNTFSELFLAWCTNPRNCVIVTSRSGEGTLAHQIVKAGTDSKVTLLVKKRVRLVGEELEEYRYVFLLLLSRF